MPNFDLEKIKYGVDESTFQKAVSLYENGKVTKFNNNGYTYTATVLGTQQYRVIVSNRHYDEGNCECYLGQNDTLCKHMVAVAIYAVAGGGKLKEEDKQQVTKPFSSRILGELNKENLKIAKKEITHAISFIKYYQGPSRTWFAYQDSLTEGVNRLSTMISKLPISKQTTGLIVQTLLRLDKKLQSGVDDSDGTVGGFIEEAVDVLIESAKVDSGCKKEFEKLRGRETCFGWEDSLLQLIDGKVKK